ncbi:hypothetical protein BDW74DRAFT_188025 [Aspergillus multicolor]|uniref:uncharacterized protein n=1 Tax=Aspergillus multicolor TaxID=41759 RepID=UPI003CCD57B1
MLSIRDLLNPEEETSTADYPLPPRTSKRIKKACTECRQQKARCDAYQRQPCSRCEKLGIDCVKYEKLEKETDELRKQLNAHTTSRYPLTPDTPTTMMPDPADSIKRNGATDAYAEANDLGHIESTGTDSSRLLFPDVAPDALPHLAVATLESNTSNGSKLPDMVPGSIYKNTANGQTRPQLMHPPVGMGPIFSKKKEYVMATGLDSGRTLPRTLGGVTLSADEIDEIFGIFYRQYVVFMPCLDTESPPNLTYEQSDFLFWTIIGTASRTCAKNPTVFPALSKHIIQMAFLSPLSDCGPWNIVQGLLLVLNWPFPKGDGGIDIIFPLTGLLLHVAMMYGMHNPVTSHEFYKTKQPIPHIADISRRSELWAYTVITYQRACLMKGQPPRPLPDMAHDVNQRRALYQNMSPHVRTRMKAQEVVTQCGAAVSEYGVLTLGAADEGGLDLLLKSYEQRIYDLHIDSTTWMARFDILVACLSVQGMHFLKIHTLYADNRLGKLVTATCDVIDAVEDMAHELPSLAVCPSQGWFGLLLGGAILLRIIKGHDTDVVDFGKARNYFMKALNLVKLMVVNNEDMPSKVVAVLSHLYNSTKAFRKPDGSVMINLRIRSRLALCPIIDAMWWFKDEFEPPLPSASAEENTDKSLAASEGQSSASANHLYDDGFWTDLEWALNIPE